MTMSPTPLLKRGAGEKPDKSWRFTSARQTLAAVPYKNGRGFKTPFPLWLSMLAWLASCHPLGLLLEHRARKKMVRSCSAWWEKCSFVKNKTPGGNVSISTKNFTEKYQNKLFNLSHFISIMSKYFTSITLINFILIFRCARAPGFPLDCSLCPFTMDESLTTLFPYRKSGSLNFRLVS